MTAAREAVSQESAGWQSAWRSGATAELVAALRRLRKKAELMVLAQEHLTPAQLEDAATVRSYELTTAGRKPLDAHPEVVAKHPIQRFRFREQNSQI